jgi:hypothetical protein
VNAFVSAGAGFLLAVLWFDLMFDVQVLPHPRGEVPEAVLDSIAAYYARVTTAARPMNRLVATVMLATLSAIVVELAAAKEPGWIAWCSLALTLAAVGLAGARIVPSAVRLGTRGDTVTDQSLAARSICRGHLLCALAILGVLGLQLGFG